MECSIRAFHYKFLNIATPDAVIALILNGEQNLTLDGNGPSSHNYKHIIWQTTDKDGNDRFSVAYTSEEYYTAIQGPLPQN
jgi:hypothetical protein